MALTSEATTIWKGTLFEGSGDVSLDSSGLATFGVNWDARAAGMVIVKAKDLAAGYILQYGRCSA